jgi:hypothetical protein
MWNRRLGAVVGGADAAGNARLDPGHDPVVGARDQPEVAPQQLTVERPEPVAVLAGDLEPHDRMCHLVTSTCARRPPGGAVGEHARRRPAGGQ